MPQFATEQEINVVEALKTNAYTTPSQAGSAMNTVQNLLVGRRLDNKALIEKIKTAIQHREAEHHNAL